MTIRASEAFRSGDATSGSASDESSETRQVELQLEGDRQQGRKSGFSILLRGDVVASSILSSAEPTRSVTELENNTKLLAGSLRGETAGFVLEGTIVAAEFDDPVPTVKLDGGIVDPAQWPSVKETAGHGAAGELGPEPFATPTEPGTAESEPITSVVTLEATDLDEASAYGLDVDGEVVDSSDSTTVSEKGDRVHGYLLPGWSATVEVAGSVTRVDAGSGIDFSVRAGE